jgi:IS5 family transposase
LSQELAEVNDRICQLRPARTIEDEDELEQLKKKLRRHFAEKRKRK